MPTAIHKSSIVTIRANSHLEHHQTGEKLCCSKLYKYLSYSIEHQIWLLIQELSAILGHLKHQRPICDHIPNTPCIDYMPCIWTIWHMYMDYMDIQYMECLGMTCSSTCPLRGFFSSSQKKHTTSSMSGMKSEVLNAASACGHQRPFAKKERTLCI